MLEFRILGVMLLRAEVGVIVAAGVLGVIIKALGVPDCRIAMRFFQAGTFCCEAEVTLESSVMFVSVSVAVEASSGS